MTPQQERCRECGEPSTVAYRVVPLTGPGEVEEYGLCVMHAPTVTPEQFMERTRRNARP